MADGTAVAPDAGRAQSADADAIIHRFDSWMQVQDLSQVEAARIAGCSAATLSQVLRGEYNGRTEVYVDKMKRALDRSDRRASAPPAPRFAKTSVVQETLDALRAAHDEGGIVIIMGEPGIGKSATCAFYCRAEPETVYVALVPWEQRDKPRPVRPVLIEIAAGIGLPVPTNCSGGDLVKLIGKRLAGSGRLLIIDEIDYAHEGLLQVLRAIHDISQVGLALVATPAFFGKLKRRQSATLNQVLSRVSNACTLAKLTDEDLDMLLADVKLDPAARAAIHHGAHGSARRLIKGLRRAQDAAQKLRQPLDAKRIIKAFDSLPQEV